MDDKNPRESYLETFEEAVRWQDALRGERADTEKFWKWLRKSPRQVEELLTAGAIVAEIAALAPDGQRRIRERARERASNGCASVSYLVPLARESARGRRFVPAVRWSAAAALAVLAIGAHAPLDPLSAALPQFSARVGEHREIPLADGSTMWLNTGSRARVDFSPDERRVELLSGEALFEVRHDARRPFVVTHDGVDVRALGTRFDVYQQADGMTVTVTQGHVRVSGPTPSALQTLDLFEGDQARLGRAAEAHVERGMARDELDRRFSWAKGMLIFSGTPLSTVVAEFNRYTDRQPLIIADPAIAEIRVGGAFRVSSAATLAHGLQTILPVRAMELKDAEGVVRGYVLRRGDAALTSPPPPERPAHHGATP